MMKNDWSGFRSFVDRHASFLVTTHTRPDGDALGSQLALAACLRSLGKFVVCAVAGTVPPRYRFFDPDGAIVEFPHSGPTLPPVEAAVIVDTGTFNQLAALADPIRRMAGRTFVIDHHQTQDDLGGERLVDTSAESCGRLVREAIAALEAPLTPDMAHVLFAALATDTGWFRHTNVSPATFLLAAELMAAGARPNELFEKIYETTTLGRLRLRGQALQRLQTTPDGRIAWIEVLRSDFEATGSVPMDTEDLINDPRSLPECQIALALIEQHDGQVKVSFRSRAPYDVARLAETFGGGGHARAAGATVPGPMPVARDRVVHAATELLR
jgi:phosphoesterase RecJ-like protein